MPNISLESRGQPQIPSLNLSGISAPGNIPQTSRIQKPVSGLSARKQPRIEITPPFKTYSFEIRKFQHFVDNAKENPDFSLICSEQFELFGYDWRLKISPMGVPIGEDSFVTVFLEVLKGPQNPTKFIYKIEIKKFRSTSTPPNPEISKTFVSEFKEKDSWGWPKFTLLSRILNEGCLNEDGSIFMIVSIKPDDDSSDEMSGSSITSYLSESSLAENVQTITRLPRSRSHTKLKKDSKNFCSNSKKPPKTSRSNSKYHISLFSKNSRVVGESNDDFQFDKYFFQIPQFCQVIEEKRNQTERENQYVQSSIFEIYGMEWKLKVYPSHTFLAAFLEMVKGSLTPLKICLQD